MRILHIAATGMSTMAKAIQNISNNLSNATTIGYKRGFLLTADLPYYDEKRVGGPSTSGSRIIDPVGIQYGSGAAVQGVFKEFNQGDLVQTGQDLNLAISGSGFFIVNKPDGSMAYTREGIFNLDPSTNQIVTSMGYVLAPGISVPLEAKKVTIKRDGTILADIDGQIEPQELGRLQIAEFVNKAGLQAVGNNLYLETDASGVAQIGNPGENNFGAIMQGFYEASTVEPVNELTNMIMAQRSYDTNAKTIQVANEMQKKINEMMN